MSEGYQNLDIDGAARHAAPRAMLLTELEDFVTRHRACASSRATPLSPSRMATF